MIKLIGILIVAFGFAIKLDIIAVVLVAGVITGLVSGLSFVEILTILGKSFIDSRYMTLFILTLPIIGTCERYGLKDKATDLISQAKELTTGRLLSLYLLIREIAAALSLNLNGHLQFVRPLINPMAQAAAINKYGKLSPQDEDKVKGASAAMENLGNFFAQNIFIANSGVLLIQSTLAELKYNVNPASVALASIPVAVITFILALCQNILIDKKLSKKYGKA